MVELRIVACFFQSVGFLTLIPQPDEAASRLWVNPFGSQASHFPYIALTRDTGGDIAGISLWLRVESLWLSCA